MRALGISAYFHDSAAALVEDGVIVAAAQEERFTRIKHDASLPLNAVKMCLDTAGVDMRSIDTVVFYEKPLRKFERLMVTHLREFPRGIGQFSRAMGTWLSKRLWMKGEIARELGCDVEKIVFSDHHLSHAASAFLCSPFQRAAILTVDGVGEWATTSIYRGISDADGSRIESLGELHFPHSIGLLYSAITAYLGFTVNEGEYKVMGLAAYGKPRFLDEFCKIATIAEDASLSLDPRYFAYAWHSEKSFTSHLEALLGPARVPGTAFDLPAPEGSSAQRWADVAASLQAFTERYMLVLARHAQKLTGETCLAMAGGVALNSVANRRLMDEGPFTELFVQPAAGDAGGALGAALLACHVVDKQPRGAPMTSAFLGEEHTGASVRRFLDDCRVKHTSFADRSALYKEVANRLASGEIGGWFQGRFEWGPRALGGRSILADPRDSAARERVNRKIKFREPFRPFAPAVLAEEHDRWFVPVSQGGDHTTRFMCSVAPATEEARLKIPAVVHVDGTSRVGVVESGPLHELLLEFRARTGIGVLLNTSMNLKDEPICGSPAEAYGTFLRSDLDFLVLEDCLIERRPKWN